MGTQRWNTESRLMPFGGSQPREEKQKQWNNDNGMLSVVPVITGNNKSIDQFIFIKCLTGARHCARICLLLNPHNTPIWQIYSSFCKRENYTLVSCPKSQSSPTRTLEPQPPEGVMYSGRLGRKGSRRVGQLFSILCDTGSDLGRKRSTWQSSPKAFRKLSLSWEKASQEGSPTFSAMSNCSGT